jgi:MoaA/NifB/PqqE/SkfB family radical SAM enzyme
MAYFDLKVGFTCNNNCVHCVVADKRKTPDLTTQEIKDIIDKIPVGDVVGFTGGEPSIRSDFIELVDYSVKTNHKIAIQTNGTGFADDNIAKEFSKHGDDIFVTLVAIHSFKKDIHDKIVQHEGMFEKTMSGFRNLLKHGVRCGTQTVLTRLNIDSLFNTYVFIQEECPGIPMNMTYPHCCGNAFTNRHLIPSYSEIKVQVNKCFDMFHDYIQIEAIPLCYIDNKENIGEKLSDLNLLSTNPEVNIAGVDPSNADDSNHLFDNSGYISSYKVAQLGDRRKGPKCEQCVFDNYCPGVWKEYFDFFRDKLDLIPVLE